jgi:hypothetical protein
LRDRRPVADAPAIDSFGIAGTIRIVHTVAALFQTRDEALSQLLAEVGVSTVGLPWLRPTARRAIRRRARLVRLRLPPPSRHGLLARSAAVRRTRPLPRDSRGIWSTLMLTRSAAVRLARWAA